LINAVAENIRTGDSKKISGLDNTAYHIGVIRNGRRAAFDLYDPDCLVPPVRVNPGDFAVLASREVPEFVLVRLEGETTPRYAKVYRYKQGDTFYGIPREYGARVNEF
jgi:hypothetical protein